MKDQIMTLFCVQMHKILFINLFNDQCGPTPKSLVGPCMTFSDAQDGYHILTSLLMVIYRKSYDDSFNRLQCCHTHGF